MLICPKCKKQLEDGTTFCDGCGTKLPETIFCPNCGKQTSTEFDFCQSCGASVTEKSAVKKTDLLKKLKSIPKKWLAISTGALAVIILVISLITIFAGGSGLNYTLYLKDDEIFFNDFSDNSWQITTRFFNDSDEISDSYMDDYASSISQYCTLSDDGKILFFPDKIDDNSEGISLYYRFLNKPEADAIKISSDITSYSVNKKATVVTYKKGEDGVLYQYNIKKDSTEKISSDVTSYRVSEDGKTIYYLNTEDGLYVQYIGKDREKLDSDVEKISYVTEDSNTIYYVKEGSLYRKNGSKDKEKIASDVSSVLKIYETGEVYFLKSEEGESSLLNYVYDDMKDTDASMIMPQEPSAPSWGYYDTTAEYEAAYSQYESDYTDYLNAYDAYRNKLVRDELREQLSGRTLEQSNAQLCYYNGKEVVTVTDGYSDYTTYASLSPVIIFKVFNQASFEKVKLSEIVSIYDIEELVEAALYSSSEQYIAIGAEITLLEQTGSKSFRITAEGDVVYYIDDIPEGKEYGDLYQIKISKGKVGDAELYDSDVSTSSMYFVAEDQLMYFKDVNNDDYRGELYINKTKIDYDVRLYTVSYIEETKTVVYFTDWNDEKDYGTLKAYVKDKSTKISDDVHSYELSSNGDILYLYDYSTTYYKGDLYVYKKGKTNKIDTDVVAILPVYSDN